MEYLPYPPLTLEITRSRTLSSFQSQKGEHEGAPFITALDPRWGEGQQGFTRSKIKPIPPLLTVQELAISQFVNEITDMSDWAILMQSLGFVEEKKDELLRRSDPRFTTWMANYSIAELRREAHRVGKRPNRMMLVFNGNIAKSDIAIPNSLRENLANAVAALTNVPDHKKHWLPGSNNTVLPIVDPSLYLLIYGVTRVLKSPIADDDYLSSSGGSATTNANLFCLDNPKAIFVSERKRSTVDCECCIAYCGEGNVVEAVLHSNSELSDWHKLGIHSNYQWLPCDIDIRGNLKIVSYINNLHPQKHELVYAHLEDILTKLIPLWDSVLTPLRLLNFRRWNGPFNPKTAFEYEHEDDEAFHDAVDIRKEFSEAGLQIIIDIHEIDLTPDHPEYAGGEWQASGRMNEHICATAVYLFDDENVAPGHMAFRQAIDVWDFGVKTLSDGGDYLELYGLQQDQPAVQELGSVQMRQGRVVAFSNILQHRVLPFKLIDPTRPGHRKVLVVHLVDPNTKVISTSSVPCQQRDWWSEAVDATGVLSKLPLELRTKVFSDVDCPIGLEEAKQLREDFLLDIEEYRKVYQVANFESQTIIVPDV